MPRQNDQLDLFSGYLQPVIVPQGDGSYLVRPGKPVDWLSVRQFAQAVGLSPSSVRRYIGTECLPEEMVQSCGLRKWRIQGGAVAHFTATASRLRASLRA